MTAAGASPAPKDSITGLVLAGGLARRMQSTGSDVDKGLLCLRGKPMIAHVIERLAPQVGRLLINANRNQEHYRDFGHAVVPDSVAGYAGPLAGLHAGLGAAGTSWVVTVPCDSPFFPHDLVQKLFDAAAQAGADLAVARTGRQAHPVFALVHVSLLADLEAFLAAGERKIDRWYAPLRTVEVDFPDEAAFSNINTPQELAAFESRENARATIEAVARGTAGYDPGALPVMQAQAIIRRFISPIDEPQEAAVLDCLGRVLARDLISPIDVPAHDNSAMDGYAVRGSDLVPDRETRLTVVGTCLAGKPYPGQPGKGEAVRIMTGGVMPPGTDTVVIQEVARLLAPQADPAQPVVLIPPGQQTGQNRRHRGEDLAQGKPALRAGKILTPADLGLAASLGLARLPVQRRLKVAFFSTGDELLSVGDAPVPGKVYDSNRYTIHGMLARLGAEPIDLGVVPDRPEALEQAMVRAGREADAVISSGGVSVGEADFTREVMARVGDVAFWTIAMRPGRPMAFGRVGDAYYFGLPGNPVAVMVTFYFFVRDALHHLMGASPAPLASIRARSLTPVRKKPGRTEYQRATLSRADDGSAQVRVTGSQGSGVLRSMSEADCMMVLAHEQGGVAIGDWVDAVPFTGLV